MVPLKREFTVAGFMTVGDSYEVTESTGNEKFTSISHDTLSRDMSTSLSFSSPVMESTKEECPSIQDEIPDTHELCRRLEEKIACLTKMGGNLQKENRGKIACLTKMGGNLQKENREMADLMKTQGKKLRKVKETEKRIRKTAR